MTETKHNSLQGCLDYPRYDGMGLNANGYIYLQITYMILWLSKHYGDYQLSKLILTLRDRAVQW